MPTNQCAGPASWLGTLAAVFLAVPLAGADEPPRLDAREKPLLEQLRTLRGNIDLIDDTERLSTLPYPSKYVLKLSLTRVPKALDAQLKLDGEGLLINGVIDGGPADNAGLKAYDVLVAADEKPIKKVSDLIAIVNESEGKEIVVKVLREGEPTTVTVKPDKGNEYAPPRPRIRVAKKSDDDGKRVFEAQIRELEKSLSRQLQDAGVDVRMQLIEPARVVPLDFLRLAKVEFPDDLSIHVHKEGKKPARIEVTRGDESWTTTEDKLDELPDEVRKHVRALLGRSAWLSVDFQGGAKEITKAAAKEARMRAEAAAEAARERAQAARQQAEVAAQEAQERAAAAAEEARRRAGEIRARVEERLERQLDDLHREMNELRKRVEQLRRSQPERDKTSDNEEPDDEA